MLASCPLCIEKPGSTLHLSAPREHDPPHVHVVRAGGEVIITLGDEASAPAIREVHHMTDRDVLRAYRIVERHR